MDPSRHAEDRNALEAILRHLPGFRGYLEKEYRRESDQLARTWIADQLQAGKGNLDGYLRRLIAAARLDALADGERLKAKLDKLGARIRGDVQGYSGVFDFVRVREGLLDQVYEHDVALLNDVEQLTATLKSLGGDEEDPGVAIGRAIDAVEQLEVKYNQRGDLLSGLSEA